jgi:hypothetical protein
MFSAAMSATPKRHAMTRNGSHSAVRCTLSTKHIYNAFVAMCIVALGCQIAYSSIWTSRDHSLSSWELRKRSFRVFLRQPQRLLSGNDDDDDDLFSMAPSSMAQNAPSRAPSMAPSVAERSMTDGESMLDDSDDDNTGIIVGSVVGAVMVGMLLLVAAYVQRRNAPPTSVPSNPAANPRDFRPVAPAEMIDDDEIVPPAASVIPSAIADPVTDTNVRYKDQCRSVTDPPDHAAAAPPDARAPASSDIPLAVAVAMALDASTKRPPIDP